MRSMRAFAVEILRPPGPRGFNDDNTAESLVERRTAELACHFADRVLRHDPIPFRIALDADLDRRVEEYRLDRSVVQVGGFGGGRSILRGHVSWMHVSCG